jgi:hypothetical protein
MGKLSEIFNNHDGKGCGKWEHYPDIYERHLEKFVGKEVTVFELGVCKGGSLQVWKKYLGEKSKIIGVDVDPYSKYEEDQIEVYTGNVLDQNLWMEIVEKHGQPDIIIDDASHIQQEILQAFSMLYHSIKDGGVYIIEDTHTAYRPNFGGGITSPLNVVSIFGRLVNDVNTHFIEEPYTNTLLDLKSVHFYNSMIVFEKEWMEKPKPIFFGDEKYKNELTDDKKTMQISTSNKDFPVDNLEKNVKDQNDLNDSNDWKRVSPNSSDIKQKNPTNTFDEDIFKWNV